MEPEHAAEGGGRQHGGGDSHLDGHGSLRVRARLNASAPRDQRRLHSDYARSARARGGMSRTARACHERRGARYERGGAEGRGAGGVRTTGCLAGEARAQVLADFQQYGIRGTRYAVRGTPEPGRTTTASNCEFARQAWRTSYLVLRISYAVLPGIPAYRSERLVRRASGLWTPVYSRRRQRDTPSQRSSASRRDRLTFTRAPPLSCTS